MMRTNSIYDALGSVDDKLVSEAANVRRKRPTAIIITACAAVIAGIAVLAMMTGSADRGGSGDHKLAYRVGSSEEISIELKLTPYEFINPDEKYVIESDDWHSGGEVQTERELFEMTGITPFMNENFDYANEKAGFDIFDTGVGSVRELILYYYLYDKNLDVNVKFEARYQQYPQHSDSESYFVIDEDERMELLTLNDGSPCLLTDDIAYFCYNGIRFHIDKPLGIEPAKQVLADLGVL